MISFNLRCPADHEFEGWFKDSATFDEQLRRCRIECPVCGSTRLCKAPSTPNISPSANRSKARAEKHRALQAQIREYHRMVEKTHENVGDRFAEEARKIHYKEADERPIYGKATLEEARALLDEEVPVAPLPHIAPCD